MEIRKKTILFFEPSTGYGGSAKCLLGWLSHLDKTNFNPIIVTYFDGPAIKDIKRLGIEFVKAPYFNKIKILSLSIKGGGFISYIIFCLEFLLNIIPVTILLTSLVKIKDVDLIDINTSMISGIPAILASKIMRKPCICHIHDTRKLTKREKFLGNWVYKFFVLTNEAFKLYSKELDPNKLNVLYNGIDLSHVVSSNQTDKVRRELGIKDQPVVGMVGRITKGKGHDDFIKAAKLINKEEKDVKFLVVGSYILVDRDYEQEIRKQVNEMEMESEIIFTGWREDARRVMSTFDILVFPSSTFPEGFPLTCIEAMALGKPVVATNIPGPSEIVLDGITGFLVPVSNPEAIADKVKTLIHQEELAGKMGEAARKRTAELFDINKLTKQIEREYLLLINNRREDARCLEHSSRI